ncbi:hypothetical protein VaNZ11_011854, partial [Volvox africanus]
PRTSSAHLSAPAAGHLLPPLLGLHPSELLPLQGDFPVGLGPAEIRVQLRRVSQLAYDMSRQLLMPCDDNDDGDGGGGGGGGGSIAAALQRQLCWPLETLTSPAHSSLSSTTPMVPPPQRQQHHIPPHLPGDLEARLVAHSLLTWLREEVWHDPLTWLGARVQ